MSVLTVYTKPGCAPCAQTKKYMEKNEIAYVSKDISDESVYAEFSTLNFQSVPVISNGTEHFAGFNPMKIKSMISGEE